MTHDLMLTRRQTVKLVGAGAAALSVGAGSERALAQDSDGSTLAALGLPEVSIIVTDAGYEGITGQLDAGLYHVQTQNTSAAPAFVAFMQLPEGMTAADLAAMLGGGVSTPDAAGEAVPAEEGGEGAPPEWFYTTYIAGGAGTAPGGTAHFVVNLTAGNYIVWGEDPSAPQQPVELTVAGGAASPVAGTAPSADYVIDEVATDEGFVFQLTGELTTDPQVIAVVNGSDQPHFVEFDRLPEGTTKADVDALFESFMTGTPAAGGLQEEDVQPYYFIGTQSTGTTQWHEVRIDPGSYLIACWIGDPTRGGVPHTFEGMYDVVTVGGTAASPTS